MGGEKSEKRAVGRLPLKRGVRFEDSVPNRASIECQAINRPGSAHLVSPEVSSYFLLLVLRFRPISFFVAIEITTHS